MPITSQCSAKQREAVITHGAYVGGKEAPEHYVWRSMLARCENPNATHYELYGGRGIKVSPSWHEYSAFIADMGPRPSPAHTLDRIDNDGDYEATNCRWTTRAHQQKNKTSTVKYEHNGEVKLISEWADELQISRALASYRMKTWGTLEKGKTWKPVAAVKEEFIKKSIKKVLDKYKGTVHYHMPVPSGFGSVTLDYVGCANGRYFAIEAKRPGKKPTPRQNYIIEQIAAAGGETFVIDGEEGLECLARWLAGVATGVTT